MSFENQNMKELLEATKDDICQTAAKQKLSAVRYVNTVPEAIVQVVVEDLKKDIANQLENKQK